MLSEQIPMKQGLALLLCYLSDHPLSSEVLQTAEHEQIQVWK